MKKFADRRFLRLCAPALATAMLLAGCAGSGVTAGRSKVAVVAKSTSTEFWRGVFTGAEAAATEYNLDLTITGPATEEDYETQNKMIADAVADGAEVLVFSAIDYAANAPAIDEAAKAGVQIVVIDSAVDSAAVRTYIGTDNHAAGCRAAEAALAADEGMLTVGLVNYDINSANGQAREQGARQTLESSGRATVVESINTLSEAGSAEAATRDLLAAHPELDTLIAFNEPTSVGAARAVEGLGLADGINLIAFDSNVETVDALQTGVVDALIVQNTYAMGYLGVQNAYRLLNGQGVQSQTVDTATRIITRETMFTADGQKALFPFE